MNILFVNYGDFTTNSLNHISGFAGWLTRNGHSCIVAVPHGLETLSAIAQPQFVAASYAQVLDGTVAFPNGRPADVLHAWTPRECVRKFILAHQRRAPTTRVIVHLEDNEEHLTAAFAQRPIHELRALPDDELEALLPDGISHPRRYRSLLALADGATVIVDRLRELLPLPVPTHILEPGVDFTLYGATQPSAELRADLGLKQGERVLAYTGSTTFANRTAMLELLRAVELLNAGGVPTRLVRTGYHPDEFAPTSGEWRRFTSDLGFLAKERLPSLLALADALVQPGEPGAFDDYRLPSKLPEFLASGRPVILPATNIGLLLRDGREARVLPKSDASAIADACAALFADSVAGQRMGEEGARWARQRFDLDRIGPALVAHYSQVLAQPARASWEELAASPRATESRLLVPLAKQAAPASAALFDLLESLLDAADASAANGLSGQLRAKLEAEIAELSRKLALAEKHGVNLTQELHTTRQGYEELKAWSAQRTRELEDLVAQHQRLALNFQAELVRAHEEFAAERSRLGEQIAARDDKIRRMTESFSWQATAPLRAFRRQFLDRSELSAATPPPPPTPAAEDTGARPRHHLDEPRFWRVPAGPFTIRGWCLLSDGSAPKRIRLRLGGREIFGVAQQSRPDVAHIVASPSAARSGFQVDCMVDPGNFPLMLEVADAHDAWHALVQTELIVFPAFVPAAIDTYEQWVHLYDQWDEAALAALRERVGRLAASPRISVVMPVYNTPEKWLRLAVESVLAQAYPHWELCIADDASPAPHVRPILEEFARRDPRIKVIHRERNGHISLASNSALALATGDFVALLDHDDELAPNALAEVALALARQPDADVLYSDEDKIDTEGRRFAPYFKPDFLPDLFRAQNYLTHLAVYRRTLLGKVGGFRAGFEGSQDWDLALRVFERTTPARIVHVPRILYHWRAIPGSTALTLDQKNYHVDAARRALSEHLQRTEQQAELAPVPGDHWHIRYALPTTPPLVSLLIPTRNGVRHLRRCLESIRAKTTYRAYEILVVDNGSDDPATLDYLREIASQPGTRVLPYPHPFNYSSINNFAAREARGEVLALLNDDLEVITPDWLEEMTAQALRPEIGCVGAMLYYPDDTIQHAGVLLGIGGVAGHAFKKLPRGTDGSFNRARLVQNYSAVTAACLVIRKSVFAQVGGLDERELAVAFNDVDFCLKVRAAGYWNLWTPFAEFYHHESASRGPENTPEKQQRFRREIETMRSRWGALLDADPAYNLNLSLASEQIALASPPRVPAVTDP